MATFDDDGPTTLCELVHRGPAGAVVLSPALSGDGPLSIFDGTDACTTPVLTLGEAPGHPHNVERMVFSGGAEHQLPSPSPRFGDRGSLELSPNVEPGADTGAILEELGLGFDEITSLRETGAAS